MSSTNPIQNSSSDFSIKDVKKGRNMIDANLTDAGRRWLIRTTDPFHDTEVEPAGYPDFEQSATVVQEVNMSMQISAPSGVTGNWDATIFNFPDFASRQEMGSFAALYNPNSGALSAGYSTVNYPDAGVAYFSGASGTQLLPDTTTSTAATSFGNVTPFVYISCKTRLVGLAFEVINTTAELYKQGLVTCYRMPQVNSELNFTQLGVDSGGTNTYQLISTRRHFALPPSTNAEALALPASKQWDACKGVYQVCTMTNEDNLLEPNDNLGRLMTAVSVPGSTSIGCFASGHPYLSTNNWNMTNRYFSPYNTSGCYFSGLSPQTTLQVNVKFILESAPGPRSPLATLARPSPFYDPMALRMYAYLCTRMPVGVPRDENPAGEWFQNILGILGAAASAASVIHPLFGLVGTGLSMASRAVPTVVRMLSNDQPKNKNLVTVVPVGQRKKVMVPLKKIRKR